MFDNLPLLVAFAGGLVAIVNPCGFAMLPAYLSFFVGSTGEETVDPGKSLSRALRVGGEVAAGFALVFGVVGLLLTAGARALVGVMPWAGLVVGVGVIALGVHLLTGGRLAIRVPTPGWANRGKEGSAFLFGLGFAIASLSCTMPVFLAVVTGTATRQGVASGIAVYGAYAVGMTLPLLTVTLALSLGQHTLVNRVKSMRRYSQRVSALLLIAAGAYVVLYWLGELTGRELGPTSGLVRFVEQVSGGLASMIGGKPVLWGVSLAAAVVAAITWLLVRRRRRVTR